MQTISIYRQHDGQLIEIPVFGTPEVGAVEQIKRCVEHPSVRAAALMADHHKGYAVPIGGVVAYEDAISPSGVGYDIGCGNKAVRIDAHAGYVRQNIHHIMDEVFRKISFGVGRHNNEVVDHPLFDKSDTRWGVNPTIASLKRMAQSQLGTVGSGNHYVDIFVDELDRVWVGVHFGSRGLGHKTATYFLKEAGATDAMDAYPCVLERGSALYDDYVTAMRLAGDYAYAGRDWVCSKVASIIGGNIVEEVHNHHNFAWEEIHEINGEEKKVWVVRKGATPAWVDQAGFVGGSMAENAVIIKGSYNSIKDYGPYDKHPDHYKQMCSLFSTVHGAGRVMGRMQAKGKYKNGVCVREPGVKESEMLAWLNNAGVVLRGGGLDEAPQCYKRLPDVLKAQGNTIEVTHTLTPIGVAMAGKNEFDPYKD